MIEENVKKLLSQIPKENKFGETVTLVAAVKTQPVESINEAISAGVTEIGDNHAQEFKDRYDAIVGNPKRHFIGHLQTNKIKYLLGRVDLYHSIDRMELAEELSKKSEKKGLVSEILIQVNAGNQETKGGFSIEETFGAYEKISSLPGLKVTGLMTMLPFTDDETILRPLAKQIRALYDSLREKNEEIRHLSMGMSGDWKICVDEGSNMVRVGTAIFGERHYG